MTAIASEAATVRLWSAVEPESIELRFLDDEAAVYAASSDSTHLLSSAAGAALQVLIDRGGTPLTIEELLQAAAVDGLAPEGPGSRSERAAIEEVLSALERIGLVAAHAA